MSEVSEDWSVQTLAVMYLSALKLKYGAQIEI